jgi:hypothetical protein
MRERDRVREGGREGRERWEAALVLSLVRFEM